LQDAAADLAERRQQQPDVVERVRGDGRGNRLPDNVTIRPERAAADLSEQRQHEARIAEAYQSSSLSVIIVVQRRLQPLQLGDAISVAIGHQRIALPL